MELGQIQPDGNIRPVAFASRSLLSHEKKYSIGELETLACIYAVEKWDRYLAGRHLKGSSNLMADTLSRIPLTAHGNVSHIEEEAAINSIITDALPIENSKSLFLK